MNIEKGLISAVVRDGSIAEVVNQGVTPEFFHDASHRRVYTQVHEHWTKYGKVMSARTFAADNPTFAYEPLDEPLPFYVERLKKAHALRFLDEKSPDLVTAISNEDLDVAVTSLSEMLLETQRNRSRVQDVNLAGSGAQTKEEFAELWALGDGLRGIPSGFGALDQATQGFQPQQLVTVAGPPKAGKSTVFTLAALAAYNHGCSPLLVNFEMSNVEVKRRLHAFDAGISHSKMMRNMLNPDERKRLDKSIDRLDGAHDFHMLADPHSSSTVSAVQAKIQEHDPDIVFIDGVYMMQDEMGEKFGSPQALTNITRAFKRLAMQAEKPIVISTQVLPSKMDKGRVTADAIGYSSSFGQDSDVVIGVEPHPSHDNVNLIKVLLARNCGQMTTYVDWDWERGRFTELEGDPDDADAGFDAPAW